MHVPVVPHLEIEMQFRVCHLLEEAGSAGLTDSQASHSNSLAIQPYKWSKQLSRVCRVWLGVYGRYPRYLDQSVADLFHNTRDLHLGHPIQEPQTNLNRSTKLVSGTTRR